MTDLQQLDADRQKFLSTVRDIMLRPERWIAAALDIEIEATINSLRQLQALAAFHPKRPGDAAATCARGGSASINHQQE